VSFAVVDPGHSCCVGCRRAGVPSPCMITVLEWLSQTSDGGRRRGPFASGPGIIDKLTQLRGLFSEVRHRKREIMENTSKTVAFHMIGPIARWGQQQFVVETWKV
jgi:hypothetical protein